MNNLQRWTIAGCALSVCSTSRLASAQQTNAIPPVRQLGPQVAVSSGFGSVAAIRPLSDGRVLVADAGKRRLVLLDSTLSHEVVVADSTPTTNKAFGSSRAGLLRYAGDSTLFIDANAIALLLIDPSGHIVRTMAPPRPEDLASLVVAAGPAGTATFSRGGLVYPLLAMTLTNGVIDFAAPASPKPGGAVGSATDLTAPPKRDSQFIVRADIQTRRTDTIGFVAVPPLPLPVRHTAADGSVVATTTTNPIELIDGWAVVADGSVAFVRAQNYHIDWANADGSRSSTPQIAHTWQRLSDSAKAAIVDSTNGALDVPRLRWARTDSIARATGRPLPERNVLDVVSPSQLPDYRPPFGPNAVKADAEDNLWIRQTPTGALGPPIYDIVNRAGRLIDRVQLPPSLTLVGFGPGVAYLTSREGNGLVLAKYRVR